MITRFYYLLCCMTLMTASMASNAAAQTTAASPRPTVVDRAQRPSAAVPPQPPTEDAAESRAAQATESQSAAATELTNQTIREKVSQRLEELQTDTEIDEPTKAELQKKYKAIQEWLRTADEANKKVAEYEADVQQAPSSLAKAKLELSEPVKETVISVPPGETLAQIEQLAGEVEARLKDAQDALAKREEAMQRRGERKNEIAKLTEETKQRLEETRKQLSTPPTGDEAGVLVDARRLELEARLKALESQLMLYRAEASRHDAFAELLPLSRDLAKRKKDLCEKELSAWQRIVADHRKRESERQAAETRRQVQNAHPALRSLAERNAALAEQRKELANSMARVSQQLAAVNKHVEKLAKQCQKAESRVRRAGHSTTVGLLLRRQREELPNRRECNLRLREIEREMPLANLALIELEEERELLGNIESAVPSVMALLDTSVTVRDPDQLQRTVRELHQTKLDLLGSLVTDYETYLDSLSELEVSNGKLADQIQQSSDYIGEHVLWIRSADPLWVDDLPNAAHGLAAISSRSAWLDVVKHCGLDTIQRPLPALSVFVVVVLIVASRRKLRAKMVALCLTQRGTASLRFRPTVEAIVLAAIIAAEWPLLLAYLGWRMSQAEATQGLTVALGVALQYAAILLWVSDFIENVLRSGGLAESHFGWPACSVKLLRRKIRWLSAVGIPLAVFVVGMEYYQEGEWSASLGRMAFVAGMLLLIHFMHSVLKSRDNILREAISQDAGNWFARLRSVSYAVGVIVPGVLAVLAIAGYYYSAQQVAMRWQATFGVALALLFGYSVAARWCLVKRRNLAMQQARERQRQASEVVVPNPDPSVPVPNFQVEDQQPDLSAIHEQLRYLLRHAVTVGMVVAAWFIWADTLPALKVLDRVVLWEKTVEVSKTHETADGKLERTTEEKQVATTLRHALFACLLVAATLIFCRNLPALLQVTVLQRLPFDNGGRHALSILLKYTVALLGVFLACRTMSITWTSVQWLAAGMTVGLGFGLQEIFANFVSGLILLFERPIRVGDVITLGDVTGTVTNIRIRATTVTNWDRKELIVPNKDLITGRLLNWTLTDTTNRIVITIGVAYESDPQRARDLILEVVASHPNVLDDPAPRVTFDEFADSTLNIVVRAYLSSMDVRLATVHDLHVSIHRTLREAGIDIAFPQRDIHIRGLEQAILPGINLQKQEAA